MAVQPRYYAPGPPSRTWVSMPLLTASNAPPQVPGQAHHFVRAYLLKQGDTVFTIEQQPLLVAAAEPADDGFVDALVLDEANNKYHVLLERMAFLFTAVRPSGV